MNCPSCDFLITFQARFCPCCGLLLAPQDSLNDFSPQQLKKNLRTNLSRLFSAEELLDPPSHLLLEPGTSVAQRYEIIEEIGQGGMGTVYRVHDHELEEVVALKVMNPLQEEGDRMLARFKREIKLARRLVHKNICRIFDFGTDGPLKFVTMELISGHELNALMQKGMIPEFPDKITIFHGVLSGLEEAHREGIIHRDLKPENILIRQGFHPVIMDFGIAREIHMSRLTYTGQIFGTPLYMSPEQFLGQPLDQRTDIYSLGVIVYELFTGETPFQGTTPFTVAMGHLKEPPQSPRVLAGEIPPNLEHIILRMLEKTPQSRYPSVRQIKEELELVPTTPPATVLIAEQDKTLRLALTRCLNRQGYHVLQAETGPEALELSLLHLPNLICLNLRIPQMEGLRVAEMLREHPSTQQIPLFLLLGLNDQQYIAYGRQLGIRDYFVTPPDLQEFTSRIEQRLNPTSPSRSYNTPQREQR